MLFWYEYVAILAWVLLLIAALFMLYSFYICDSEGCKAFKQSCNITCQKDKTIAVLNALGNDGMWCFAFIGSSILSFLVLWFLQHPVIVREYAIIFLTQFLVIYVLFAFYNHHYIKPIKNYAIKYINSSCPNCPPQKND